MYVIGTAGHVDHGKSTLVEALTGIDPDRLAEEKKRGMTIDLGFAWMELPNGNEISIVDVPGHERFVNNMLAGVGGVDLALLVVAADESVMPQTREHLAILDLLHVERGIVAVTKKDTVDEDWLELVASDVEDVLKGTSLEGSPILSVSALTGEGLPELVAGIERTLEDTSPKRDVGRPRLPIDRSFTISGFGTVVTGTLIDGNLRIGEEMELVVSGRAARIRGLQTHRQKVDLAVPGTRVAANLSGVSHDQVVRGEVLADPGWLRASLAVDVHLRIIPDAAQAVRHNMFVTVHTGSAEGIARLRLLDKARAEPGESTWAQLKFDKPMAVVKGDYFVIRSNQTTLGGGNIVAPHARRHRRMHEPILERLSVMEEGSDRDVILKTLELSEPSEFQAVVNRANLQPAAAKAELEAMADEGLVVVLGRRDVGPGVSIFSGSGWASVMAKARGFLESYHGEHSLRKGAPKEELRSRLGMNAQVFNAVLARMEEAEEITEEGALVRLPSHAPQPTEAQEVEAQSYLRVLDSDPFSPPTDSHIDGELLSLLVDEGRVVKVSESVVFSAIAHGEMVDKISTYIKEHGEITVADVRDLFGTSRKYALALMDDLDHQRITRRVGDARVLR